jgi:hypothetical protein
MGFPFGGDPFLGEVEEVVGEEEVLEGLVTGNVGEVVRGEETELLGEMEEGPGFGGMGW